LETQGMGKVWLTSWDRIGDCLLDVPFPHLSFSPQSSKLRWGL
jgi:hypothetical protein